MMGGIVPAVAGFGPCFFNGFTSLKASRLWSGRIYPMRRNHEIGTAAGKAKHVRLIRFEHTVRLLEFAKIGTNVAEVGYEVKRAHLWYVWVTEKEDIRWEYCAPKDHTSSPLQIHDYRSSPACLDRSPCHLSFRAPRPRGSSLMLFPLSPSTTLYPLHSWLWRMLHMTRQD